VTTDQVLFGVGLILVLAVGSQVLASRLRIPALIILLPAGFIAGAVTTDISPERLLRAAFQRIKSEAERRGTLRPPAPHGSDVKDA
jgi:Kef-type K+ transport system membrane component KefB